MPPKARKVIGSSKRFKVLEGGRGSAKSYSFADALVVKTRQERKRVLCTREMQNSIKDSVHRLLTDRIDSFGFTSEFNITRESITHNETGSEFLFKGLRHNISEIKSTEGIDICWVEEAEKVSEDSWDILIPTIRKPGSEIWISFNPENEHSATHKLFIEKPSPEVIRAHMTFRDNKYFPEVLRRQMEYDKSIDPEKYMHVWEGQVKKYSESLIFHGKIHIEEFETPDDAIIYQGADWGFSTDPTVLVRCFIDNKDLYIDYEFYDIGVEITDLHESFMTVPDSHKWKITGDSQRPDTISHLKREYVDRDGVMWPGYRIVGAEKGKGSVEDGIMFLRGFERIVIHPRCKGAIDNFTNYRWEQDKITKEILPKPKKGSDHVPDAIRYALEKYIKSKEPNIRVI